MPAQYHSDRCRGRDDSWLFFYREPQFGGAAARVSVAMCAAVQCEVSICRLHVDGVLEVVARVASTGDGA